MNTKKGSTDQNTAIRLVVNGGSTTLDTATVPVEWHFSDKFIEESNPKYVVICDMEMSYEKFQEYENTHWGQRYLCRVAELAKYVQLRKAGGHTFVIVVFYGSDAENNARKFVKKNDTDYYDLSLWCSDVKAGALTHLSVDSKITSFEFDVPSELFAKRPEIGLRKLIWDWTNRWFKRNPVDQCAYRKRKIFAFTLQPILFLIGRLILGIFMTLYSTIWGGIVFFFGFRTINLLQNIGYGWSDPSQIEMDLRDHRTWRFWDYNSYIPVPLVPFILVVELAAVGSLVYLLSKFLSIFLLIGATAVIFFVILTIILNFRSGKSKNKRAEKALQKQREKEQAEKDEEERQERLYAQFLKNHASFSSVGERVNINRIKPVVDTVTRFSLSFWGLKGRVCKPFNK